MSIDFQRTRNSQDDSNSTRLYYVNEIDIVAACLFPRTLKWSFLFAKTTYFPKSKNDQSSYSQSLNLTHNTGNWTTNLYELLANNGAE